MRALVLLALPALLLAGCGGLEEGCDAAVKTEAVAAYAGHYAATFTPTGASAATVTLDLTVDADGFVTGTATDSGTAYALTDYNQAGNVRNGCALGGTVFHLSYRTGESAGTSLDGRRDKRGSLVGTYSGALEDGTQATVGTLAVTKAPS